MKVYVLISDMENDVPETFTTDKAVAEHLKHMTGGIGDFLELEVSEQAWMQFFNKGLQEKENLNKKYEPRTQFKLYFKAKYTQQSLQTLIEELKPFRFTDYLFSYDDLSGAFVSVELPGTIEDVRDVEYGLQRLVDKGQLLYVSLNQYDAVKK